MITQNTSPVYVNRVHQDWMANGGVYGDGGVYYQSASNTPTLNFQFAGATAISSQITFTRASSATYYNAAGLLTSATTNTPRLDYNPSTLAAQGLLIEEARTNSIRNNTMVGAVAGTPGTIPTNWAVSGLGTLTQQVVGTGTSNGITYVDVRFSGTTSTTQIGIRFEPANGAAATNGQTFTFSSWAARVAGSTSNIGDISANANIYDSGSVYVGGLGFTGYPLTVPTTLSRVSGTGTIAFATAAFIQPQIYINFSSGVAIDITLRIGLPQLELGAFATSVIPTTTTALTRAADVASVNTLSPWYNQSEGTVYAELQSLSPLTSAQSVAINKYPHVWHIDAGATDSSVFWYGLGAELFIGGTYNNLSVVPSGINKLSVALAASGGQSASSLNGAAAVNRSGTLTGTATLFSLGKDSTNNANNFLNGYLRRITYYPRRLSNAELQTLTT